MPAVSAIEIINITSDHMIPIKFSIKCQVPVDPETPRL